MGMMDSIKGLLKGHKSQVDSGIDKGGDMVDRRTQNKYSDKVDMGQEKAEDAINRLDRDK